MNFLLFSRFHPTWSWPLFEFLSCVSVESNYLELSHSVYYVVMRNGNAFLVFLSSSSLPTIYYLEQKRANIPSFIWANPFSTLVIYTMSRYEINFNFSFALHHSSFVRDFALFGHTFFQPALFIESF